MLVKVYDYDFVCLIFSPECPAGKFGLGCHHQCQCENEALCDHVSGACTCQVGWTGTFCENRKRSSSTLNSTSPVYHAVKGGADTCLCFRVSSGFLRPGLSGEVLVCERRQLRSHQRCLFLSSRLDQPALQPEWVTCADDLETGANQTLEVPLLICRVHREVTILCTSLLAACPAGFYGKGCNQTCSCRNGGICHPASGQCECTPGWTGPTCTEGEFTSRDNGISYDSGKEKVTKWSHLCFSPRMPCWILRRRLSAALLVPERSHL